MTNEEYRNAIYGILKSGRGYQAIIDLAGYLKTYSDNVDSAIKEYKSERLAVRKICNSDVSQKDKLKVVLDLMGEK